MEQFKIIPPSAALAPYVRHYWMLVSDGLRQTAREPYVWYTADKSAATFTLATPAELREFAALVNGDAEALTATNSSGAVNFSGKTVRIADGITTLDLEGKEWTPAGKSTGAFKGTFDGNGVTVSGLNVNVASGDNAGFFGYIFGATVRNLHVTGDITAENSSSVGGIAGSANSSVIENCLFSGTVKGKSTVGGIAGDNSEGLLTTPPVTDPVTPAWSFDPQPTWTHLPCLHQLHAYWPAPSLIAPPYYLTSQPN